MERVGDDNSFTFIWEIHNFSYCTQKTGEYLRSPTFLKNNCKWNVDLFPRGTKKTPNHIGIRLGKEVSEFPIKISTVFSISTNTGPFKETEVLIHAFQDEPAYTPEKFLKVPAIHNRGIRYCNTDILIVKCKIVKVDDVLRNHQEICNAYSVIDVRKTTYNWKRNVFSNLKKMKFVKELNLFENNAFTMDFSSSKGFYGEEIFKIVINREKSNELYFSSCTLSLMDSVSILESERIDHWFEKLEVEHVWTYSFTPKINQNSYRDLILCLEFAVSKGVETIEQDPIAKPNTTGNRPVICSVPTSWRDNLHRFYSEGTLSDVTIRTPTKQFLVHKAMLCAQSAVFTAMFERDMRENQTGIVEIEDLEECTIYKMLLYVYSGSVEDLDWDLALKLYFAADKYGMAALGEHCSVVLRSKISSANVCECLILADLHQDQQLKSFAQKFIMRHSAEIINSKEWRELMKEKLSLAAETMHLLCLSNLKTS